MKKILVIGTKGCGKTTMMYRLTSGEFMRTYTPTVKPEIYNLFGCEVKNIHPEDLENEDLSIYNGFIWMFDKSDPESMKYLFKTYVPTKHPSVIIGNKCDIKCPPSPHLWNLIKKRNWDCESFYTSCISAYNLERIFKVFGVKLYDEDTCG